MLQDDGLVAAFMLHMEKGDMMGHGNVSPNIHKQNKIKQHQTRCLMTYEADGGLENNDFWVWDFT